MAKLMHSPDMYMKGAMLYALRRVCLTTARIGTHLDVDFQLGQVDEQEAQRRHRQCSKRQRHCDWRPPARLLEDVVDLRLR